MIYELETNIKEALEKYYECFDSETGELIVAPEEFAEINKGLEELQNKKDDLINYFLKDRVNKKSDNEGIETEIERLQARKKRNNNKIQFIEKFIDNTFRNDYKKPISLGNFTVSYRKSKSVIADPEKVPKEYLKEKISITVDKTSIKKAIESGEIIEGAEIQENLNLNIK